MDTRLKSHKEKPKKVLISPLDWGLGHATRMIPIIDAFLSGNWEVELATSGPAYDLLKKHYPKLALYRIASYNIRYSKHSLLTLKLFAQAPAMWKGMRAEHKWLTEYVQKHNPDLIISDDRFGVYNKKVESWYMTHQIRVLMPWYLKPFESLIRFFHKIIINQYDKCLVPDFETQSLSGVLSHKKRNFSYPVKYVGALSRFYNLNIDMPDELPDVLAIVSGQEPQRSILLNKLINLYRNFNGKVFIVAGQPDKKEIVEYGSVRVFPHMNSDELAALMKYTPVLICRSGYSSLMDIFFLKRKAILIPTPGQTEQVYLGKYFAETFGFKTINQSALKSLDKLDAKYCNEWKHPNMQSESIFESLFTESI